MTGGQNVLSGFARAGGGLAGKLVIGVVGFFAEKMLMEPLVRPGLRAVNAALNPFAPNGPGQLGQYITRGAGGGMRR